MNPTFPSSPIGPEFDLRASAEQTNQAADALLESIDRAFAARPVVPVKTQQRSLFEQLAEQVRDLATKTRVPASAHTTPAHNAEVQAHEQPVATAPLPVSHPVQAMATCPACGAHVKVGKKFCSMCGAMQSSQSAATHASPTCGQCGQPLTNPSAKFCGHCGSPVS